MSSQPPILPGDGSQGSHWERPAAGWYPDGSGFLRWWDGTAWTAHAAPNHPHGQLQPGFPGYQQDPFESQKSLALLAHLLGFFTGFIGPLVIYLMAKDDQPFVKHHAAEALNFQLTVLILMLASFVLMFVLVGFITIFVVAIGAFILEIIACVSAHNGEWYRYPVNFRMVSGAR